MIDEEIVAREGLAAFAGGVLYGGIRLERHVDLEAVPEHRGDEGQLAGHHRLALDDGGQGEELMHVETKLASRADELWGELGAHFHHHPREHFLWGDTLGELVGVGEEVALYRGGGNLESLEEERIVADPDDVVGAGESFRLDGPRELGQRPALLQEHGMVENLSTFEQAQHREGVRALRDVVLTRLEAACRAPGEGDESGGGRARDEGGL